MALELGASRAALDGELVAFDETNGRASSGSQRRMHAGIGRPRSAVDGCARRRSTYVIFDLLYLEGARACFDLPYEERRGRLEALGLDGQSWQTPAFHRGDGRRAARGEPARGLEGSSPSASEPVRPGRRTRDWLKVKNVRSQELVIGGWLPGKGRREGELGSLLVGYYDDGRLRYAGKVGNGPHRLRPAPASRAPRAARDRRDPVRWAPATEGLVGSSSRGWSPRWSSPSGPAPARFGIPHTRGCATTSRPARWFASSPPRGSRRRRGLREEGLDDADRERGGEADVDDRDQRPGPGRDRVVGAALGRLALLEAPPALEAAEEQDQDQDRVREDDRQPDQRRRSRRTRPRARAPPSRGRRRAAAPGSRLNRLMKKPT